MTAGDPLPFTRAEIEAVLRPLAEARPLPPRTYWDEAVFAFELAAIWDRSFRLVGRGDEIELPGQVLRAPLGPAGALVVRGPDLVARAFTNVCRHRGSLLVEHPCDRVACLECPYHGWTYELSGELRSAPHAPPGFDHGAHGLVPLRLGAFQGFLFAAAEPEEPDVARALVGAPPWLAEGSLPPLRRAHRSTYEVAANWKLVAENFQESHHFSRVHPALEGLTPNERAESWLGPGPWLGGTMDLLPGVETVSRSGKLQGRPFVAPPERRRRVHDALLFPGLFTSLQPDYLLTYALDPQAPDRTLVVADVWMHAAAFGPALDLADVVDFWDEVNRQDQRICEGQQLGVRSRGYQGSYVLVEDGVHAFDGLVARRYLAALGG